MKRLLTMSCVVGLCIFAAVPTIAEEAQATKDTALDAVAWCDDVATAVKCAEEQKRPLFVLFATDAERVAIDRIDCHPLIMDAIELHFVPLRVTPEHKNFKEAEKLFGTKGSVAGISSADPLIRIASSSGEKVVDPLIVAEDMALAKLVTFIVDAMKAENISAPRYLTLLEHEMRIRETEKFEKAYFAHVEKLTTDDPETDGCMEKLGSIDGVIQTTYGFWIPGEVVNGELGDHCLVEVTFDPKVASFESLVGVAKNLNLNFPHWVFCGKQETLDLAKPVIGDKATLLGLGEFVPNKTGHKKDLPEFEQFRDALRAVPGGLGCYTKDCGAPSYSNILNFSTFRYLPMIESQACRINGFVSKAQPSFKGNPEPSDFPTDPISVVKDIGDLLCPRQVTLLNTIRHNPSGEWYVSFRGSLNELIRQDYLKEIRNSTVHTGDTKINLWRRTARNAMKLQAQSPDQIPSSRPD